MFGFDFFELTRDAVTLTVGLTAVLASLGVILCSSPIYCALYLIGHMICLALLFLLYNAEFIAAVQIIVYAGAVMILFLFIIALLGGKKEIQEPSTERSLAVVFALLLFLSILSDLSDLSYRQEPDDTVDDGEITDLGSPTLAEEAESIVAEVEPSSTNDDEN